MTNTTSYLRRFLCGFLTIATIAASTALARPETAYALSDAQFNERLNSRITSYKGKKNGGVALVGSSSFAYWDKQSDSGADFAAATNGKIPADKVCNWGIGGSTSNQWKSDKYINAILSKKPKVICIYGANALKASPRVRSDNTRLVNQSLMDTSTLMDKLRKKSSKGTKFILVSTICPPKSYLTTGHCTARNATVATKGGYCIGWERFEMYNAKLREYANSYDDTWYVDLEQYYYYHQDGTYRLRFYCNQPGDKNNAVRGKDILYEESQGRRAGSTCKYFHTDYTHPTKAAYQTIWRHLAETAAQLI